MFKNYVIAMFSVFIPTLSYSEVYVCESEISSNVIAPTTLLKNNYSKNEDTYFVVDSEKGVREVNGNRHTDQPCSISGQFLVCMSVFEGVGLNSFAIDTSDFSFTYVEQNFQVRISAFYGNCVKGS